MTSEFAIAVHALVFLNHKQESQSSEEIAENVCTHSARIRKVLAKLHKAGLVSTKEGLRGGYHFAKPAEAVNLEMICQAVGDRPVEVKWSTGDMDKECQIASGMAGIMDDIYGRMNQACYRSLEDITIATIDEKIFGRGGENDKGI